MAATDPKETVSLRAILALALAIILVGCTSGSLKKVVIVDPENPSLARAVPVDVYKMMHCADCKADFQRVALPDSYELPTQDLGVCFAYVLDQNPDNRDLLISAWMGCVEAATDEQNQ
jgi:hypothetical protein